MISLKYNFIFFHLPKAAGSSILMALNQNLKNHVQLNDSNEEFKQFLSNNVRQKTWPNHATTHMMRNYLGEEKYNRFFKFIFVRNPWDRLVSFYHYTTQKEPEIYAKLGRKMPTFSQNMIDAGSFENWIKSETFGSPQYDFLAEGGEVLVDYIGRSESLQADFSFICGLLGIPNIEIPVVNKSKHKDYREYYSDETREIVAEKLKRDIDAFGYTFDSKDEPSYLDVNRPILAHFNEQKASINEVINGNDWCSFPENIFEQVTTVHPNDVKEGELEVHVIFQSNRQRPFSSIEFAARPYNQSSQNLGVNLEVVVYSSDNQVLTTQEIELAPLKRSMVKVTFEHRSMVKLVIKVKLLNNAESNAFCGTRLGPFKI